MHLFITLGVQNFIYVFAFVHFMNIIHCFHMYYYVFIIIIIHLFVCLISSLCFIHKDCLDTYCFSIFLINMHLML